MQTRPPATELGAPARAPNTHAFYRAVWPTGFRAHILCAFNLPPASLLAAL
ncbi:hypothetical protein [Hafnia alvei]|uniref:hypothetical protein n=1 Tax=Hafnia alvei TaxID=569 RepID=UPI000AB0853D|nr:hypothetical protein [Hafnia alvei]